MIHGPTKEEETRDLVELSTALFLSEISQIMAERRLSKEIPDRSNSKILHYNLAPPDRATRTLTSLEPRVTARLFRDLPSRRRRQEQGSQTPMLDPTSWATMLMPRERALEACTRPQSLGKMPNGRAVSLPDHRLTHAIEKSLLRLMLETLDCMETQRALAAGRRRRVSQVR